MVKRPPIRAFLKPPKRPTKREVEADRNYARIGLIRRALDGPRAELIRQKIAAKDEFERAREQAALAKAERASRAAPAPTRSRWAEYFAGAPDVVRDRIAAGKPPFRPGSKREICHHALIKGATITELMTALQWNKATCQSTLYEMGHLVQRRIERLENGKYRYIDE